MEAYADYLLLALATPFALWAAWSDLRTMRIPNEISLYAGLAFILVMPIFLTYESFGFRVTVAGWVLVAGFVLNALGLLGGGDAKFATAMIPFVTPGHYIYLLMAYLASILVCVALHRLLGVIARRQGVLQDWDSFASGKKFPMGLPIAVAVLIYLAANAFGFIPVERL